MSEVKYTPGPWKWQGAVPLPGEKAVQNDAMNAIDPNPRAWPLCGDGGDGHCVLRHRAPWEVGEADANLVSASPLLYEACERFDVIDKNGCQPNEDDWKVMRAALAAATGGEE